MKSDPITIRLALIEDDRYAAQISAETGSSALLRGSGISKRSAESIANKMKEGKAIIATTRSGLWAGFSYIETWGNGEFVSNSGLIVAPEYRKMGVANKIKKAIFALSRERYPFAKIFSITTGLAIMKMNARLHFETVTFNEIAKDETFWQGCKSCVNYHILEGKKYKDCICTAMLFTPKNIEQVSK